MLHSHIVYAPPDGGRGAQDAGTRPKSDGGMPKVRLTLDVSQEIADFLDQLAQENTTTKTDVMRRAIALLKVAHEEKKRNRSMGFISAARDEALETRVVGIL